MTSCRDVAVAVCMVTRHVLGKVMLVVISEVTQHKTMDTRRQETEVRQDVEVTIVTIMVIIWSSMGWERWQCCSS